MTGLEILASLIPVASEAAKSLVNKYITPDVWKPGNVQEYIQMKETDLKWYQAINAAGGTASSYLWVAACQQLMRPFICAVVLGAWAVLHVYTHVGAHPVSTEGVDSFAATIGFYLFGDRTLFYSKRQVGGS